MFLIERLDALIEQGRRFPGTNAVMVDKVADTDLIEQLRVAVPEEVRQAKRINEEFEIDPNDPRIAEACEVLHEKGVSPRKFQDILNHAVQMSDEDDLTPLGVLNAARDYTGGEIMKTLRDEVKNRGIEIVEFAPVYELLTDGKKVTGAVLYNMETEEYLIVRARTVILATGGGGRLHVMGFPTSNHYGATAVSDPVDVYAIAR